MTNVFDDLLRKCQSAGTNLTQVCRQANVSRSTIERWKSREPKTISILRNLEAIIEKERKKNLKE